MGEHRYFVHNGYVGWSYGTPGNPQLITETDAQELMRRSGLTQEQVAAEFPPAQVTEEGDPLFHFLEELGSWLSGISSAAATSSATR